MQVDGSLGTGKQWFTDSNWSAIGTVIGLSPATTYTFKSIARNESGVETDSCPESQGTTAGDVATPLIFSVSSISQNTETLNITVFDDSNPPGTEYALYNSIEGKYVNGSTGALQINEDWRVNKFDWTNSWLTPPGRPFTYQVKARFQTLTSLLSDPVNPNATHATYAVVPGAPAVSNLPSGTAQNVIINKNNNYDGVPGGVEYRIEIAWPPDYTTYYIPVGGGNPTGISNNWATYQGWGGGSGVNATGLTSGQDYSYYVKARNTYGEETTNRSSPTTLKAEGAAVPPGGLTRRLSIIKEVVNPASGILTGAGQTVTYRISVKNTGIEPTSLEYTITDILPPGFSFLGNIQAKNPAGMVVSGVCNSGNLTCEGRTLRWTLSQVINNGSQISFQYNVQAP